MLLATADGAWMMELMEPQCGTLPKDGQCQPGPRNNRQRVCCWSHTGVLSVNMKCAFSWMTLWSSRDSLHSETEKPQSELWTPWMAQPQGCQVNVPKDLFSCTIFSTYRQLYRRLCYWRLQYCLLTCINAFKISLAWNVVQQQSPGLVWNFMKLWVQSYPLPPLM